MEKTKTIRVSFTRKIRLEEKTCPICGTTFTGAKIKKYCSRACQNKANYDRHVDEYREMRRENYQKEKKPSR